LSGGNLNDTLRGDDAIPAQVGGGGFVGCDALDQKGVDRIAGLNDLIPALDNLVPNVVVDSGPIKAASATQNCLLTGNVWGAGNILLGGSGNDLLEGRGADDIIDGDRYVNVRLSVRNPASPGTEIGTTDRMSGTAKSGDFGTGTAGMTLQQAVFAGLVNPGNIVAVREILTSTTANTDVALFSGPRTEYEITRGTTGGEPFVTVNHTGGTATDGIDTLRNVETLRFTNEDVAVTSITTPVPVAEFTPATTLAFGLRDTGTPTPLPVQVTNTGLAELTVSSAVVSPAGAFTVASNTCTTVAPAGTCTITVAFAPTTTALQTAQLAIVHNAAGSPQTITLTGQGQTPVVRPVITLPATTAFGRRAIGTNRTQSVRVANQGPGVLTITSVSAANGPLTPSATAQFTAALGTCAAPVAVGRTCNLAVTFSPTVVGPLTGTLSVVSNAVGNPRTAALTGTGR
jgi:hypothetical protein